MIPTPTRILDTNIIPYIQPNLLIICVLGTPTITVEPTTCNVDLDSVSLISSIANSHLYQCKQLSLLTLQQNFLLLKIFLLHSTYDMCFYEQHILRYFINEKIATNDKHMIFEAQLRNENGNISFLNNFVSRHQVSLWPCTYLTTLWPIGHVSTKLEFKMDQQRINHE